MSASEALWLALNLLAGGLVVGYLLAALTLPAIGRSVERARIEREAQEASWRIHQQATAAFADMLDAGRQVEQPRQGRRR